MAKKISRIKIHLKCKECGRQNYTTTRSKTLEKKLGSRKFCKHCRQHTMHVEEKKLK